MIKSFLSSAGGDELIRMHVWTFTESSKECYVCKSPAAATNRELIDYVDKIKLSTPPSQPTVTDAYGGDAEENSVASISALLDTFKPTDNIMAFLITDAPPHHISAGRTSEATAEIRWLTTQDPALPLDIFQRLDCIIERLNVTFIPINYQGRVDPFYLQAALLTDGICLIPKTSDSKLLGDGLVTLMQAMKRTILNGLVDRNEAGVAIAIESLANTFDIGQADPDTWQMIEADPPTRGGLGQDYKKFSGKEEVTASLFGLLETTMDRFSGKKAGKRIRSVDPDTVAASIRVFVLAMLVRTGFAKPEHKSELDQVQAELVRHLEKNMETGKREIFYLNRLLSNVLSAADIVKPSEATSSHCVVTLQSAWDTISALEQVPRSAEDVQAWMEIVLQLTLCRLLDVRFPTDAAGRMDFMDAWSASVAGVSYGASLSTYAAVNLRNTSDDGETFRDPSTRKIHNSALLLAHPDDPILSSCYITLSALPSLQGLVQGYLVSGGLNIFPSITVGLQASTLLSVLRTIAQEERPALLTKPVEYEWLRSLVWSLAISDVIPAIDVVKSLEATGTLNPEDNPSKLMAAFIRYMKKDGGKEGLAQKWKYLYEELVTNSVSFGIRLLDNGKECDWLLAEKDIVACFIQDPIDFDEVNALHPAETFDPAAALKNASSLAKLRTLVEPLSLFRHSKGLLRYFWDLVHDRDLSVAREADDFPLINDDMLTATVESILLRKRTARYILSETKVWSRAPDVSLDAHVAALVKSVYQERTSTWRQNRALHAHDTLMNALSKKASSLEEPQTEKYWVSILKNTSFSLLSQTYTFSRMDAPSMFVRVPQRHMLTLGPAIIRGAWTSAPPSQLRRHSGTILPYFSDDSELHAEMQTLLNAQAVCCRETFNRHGHTVKNPHPGFTGWNQAYHDARMTSGAVKVAEKLAAMKEYREFLDETLPKVEVLEPQALRDLANMIIWLPNNSEGGKRAREALELIQTKASTLDEEKLASLKASIDKHGFKRVIGVLSNIMTLKSRG